MRAYSLLLSALLSAVVFSATAIAQPEENGWTKRLDEDDVLVFSREMPNGAPTEYKAVTMMLGDIDSAYAIVSDFTKLSSSDSHIKSTEILQTISPNEYFVHQIFKMSIWLKDRDIVARVHTQKTSSGYIVFVESYPEYIPAVEGTERIQAYQCIIGLRALSKESFELIYRTSMRFDGGDMVETYSDKIGVNSAFERLKQIGDLVRNTHTGTTRSGTMNASNR